MNENTKTYLLAFVAALVGGLIVLWFAGLVGNQSDGNFGGTRFPSGLSADSTSPAAGEVRGTTLTVTAEANLDTVVSGGDSTAIANSDGSETLTAAQVCDSAHIVLTPSGGNVTVTMPTSALLIADCIPTIGDTKSLWYENGATAATTTTFALGASMVLTEPSGGDVVIAQNEWAKVEIINVDGSIVMASITSTQDAD
jgi:hypothetical protein